MAARPLHRRLALRIWWALVAAIMLLTLLLGWLWRLQWEQERLQRPGRQLVVRSAHGDVLAQAHARELPPEESAGRGPEFQVTLPDGQTIIIHLPKPPRPLGWRAGTPVWMNSLQGFVTLLVMVAVAVAVGAYPVVRHLTKRLEALQRGVERWGGGDLAARLPVQGRDEVAFLAERFNAAAERVQSLLLAHKTLLANASHELRSPLARIRMGVELLGQGGPSPLARQEIARNIAELDALIDEILLASRLDLADPNQVDSLGPLDEVDVLGLAAEECARAGADLHVTDGWAAPTVRGQARLLRRLLRNLLENAQRHGGRDGGAGLEVTLRQCHGPAGMQIRVRDHGPGIPPQWRERVFEPFFRLPGASEREGGVGLGLALVKSIARRHGGKVHCEDAPGGGACFVVWLPVTGSDPMPPPLNRGGTSD